MKNLTLISLLTVIIMFTSCSKDNNSAAYLAVSVRVVVKDSLGNDLLDPDNRKGLDTDNIKIFHVKDGIAEQYFAGNLDHPKGYNIYKPEDFPNCEEYSISILLNSKETEDSPTTLVQWQKNDIDTIVAEYKRVPGYLAITKATFNGEEKWQGRSEDSEPFFEIIK